VSFPKIRSLDPQQSLSILDGIRCHFLVNREAGKFITWIEKNPEGLTPLLMGLYKELLKTGLQIYSDNDLESQESSDEHKEPFERGLFGFYVWDIEHKFELFEFVDKNIKDLWASGEVSPLKRLDAFYSFFEEISKKVRKYKKRN